MPEYQREYVWKEETVTQFFDDIVNPFTEANFDGRAAEEDFIGSVVVCPTEGETKQIIDGQQRLINDLFTAVCSQTTVAKLTIQFK